MKILNPVFRSTLPQTPKSGTCQCLSHRTPSGVCCLPIEVRVEKRDDG
jgi:hypothetical protein